MDTLHKGDNDDYSNTMYTNEREIEEGINLEIKDDTEIRVECHV
jgi:hypothetical protein